MNRLEKPIFIEKANNEDFKDFVYLNKIVQKLHSDALKERFKSPEDVDFTKDDFGHIINDNSKGLYFAKHENNLIGYIFWEIKTKTDKFSKTRSVLYINHISVDPNYRKKGVGSLLMDYALSQGKKLGFFNIELDVWSFNQDAQEFFSRKGFNPFNVKMEFSTNKNNNIV